MLTNMIRILIVVVPIISNFFVQNCMACNGHKMHLTAMENCGEDNIITVDKNFTAELSSDCMLSSTGCIQSKGFKEAKVKFSIFKDGHEILSGHPDICNILDHKTDNQKIVLELFGFPTECPVAEGEKCMDGKKVDISNFQHLLTLAVGNITANYEVTHDTGKTCAIVKLEITE